MNKGRKWSTIISIIMLTTLYNTNLFGQDIKCFNSDEGELCATDWIQISKNDLRLLQIRFTYIENANTYYVMLGRVSLEKRWQETDEAKLFLNGRSHQIKSIDSRAKKAGDGISEIRVFIFGRHFLEKITESGSSKFTIKNDAYKITQRPKDLLKKLIERVSE